MATVHDIRQHARELEARVAARGCEACSCDMCRDLDDCLPVGLPPVPPANTQTRPVVAETPKERARAAQMAQDAVFGATLPCY